MGMSRVLTEVKWGAPLKHVLLHLQTTTLHKCMMIKPQRWTQKATSRSIFVFFLFKDSSTIIISENEEFFVEYILVFSEEDN